MKLSIQVAGVDVTNYTEASIVYDAKYSSTATFTTRQPTDGTGWYSNLSKIVISGRELQADSAEWSFEESGDFSGWYVRNTGTGISGALGTAAQDIQHAAYGQASAKLDLAAGATYEIYRQADGMNMNGLLIWAWFDYFNAAGANIYVTPYALGTHRWDGPRTTITLAPQWVAAGLRLQQTATVPWPPTGITEWGFQIEAPGVTASIHMDSVHLCGHAYPAGVQLPPFQACTESIALGSIDCFAAHPCGNWDGHNWADDAHILPTDAGWCPTTGAWDYFIWADERAPSKDDYQWI